MTVARPVKSPATFRPGNIWLDSDGVPINAHGGGMLLHKGRYYWYGEHKIEGQKGNKAHVGVSCYSSEDLYHWRNEGIALAVSDDPQSPIARGCVLERPKVLFCRSTGQFAMWFHLELKGQGCKSALAGVAVSARPAGPYQFLRAFRPNAGEWPLNVPHELRRPLSADEEKELASRHLGGAPVANFPPHQVFRRDHVSGQMSRDMTLFLDDDGIAYHLYVSENNGALHISQLTPDFLACAGRYTRAFPGLFYEAPAIFKRGGRYFLFSSNCTSWKPNQARLSVADSIFGPWMELGNPCVGTADQVSTTFHSQSTYVLPIHGRPDAFIFMADRWHPENAIDGRYVWLPVQFRNGVPFLEWLEEWDLSFFDTRSSLEQRTAIDIPDTPEMRRAYELCVTKIRRSIHRLADAPKSLALAEDGDYFRWPEGFFEIGNWTSSFFTGMSLLAFQSTHDSDFLDQTVRLSGPYHAKVHEHAMNTMHDLGFLYSLYAVALYKLTGQAQHRDLGLRAAEVLASRFITNGNYIRAWGRLDEQETDYAGLAIIDCLMNLPLLFWATDVSGNSRFKDIATRHADTTLAKFVRADASVCHAYRFDPLTGAPVSEANYCGRAVGSHWARGTTWAFYGFAVAYRYTHDGKYLDAAQRIASTFIDHLDAEIVPVWDFRLQAGETPLRDSSAAAIAVCGLQELRRLGVKDPRFAKAARQLLLRLCTEDYLDCNLDCPGVLRNGQVGQGVGFARSAYTSWGDYFFMEALSNFLFRPEAFW